MNATETTKKDYKIKDISLADMGRKAIEFAEFDMPGLIALRSYFGNNKPLAGAKIAGCLNMTIQTAIFIETLERLGAEVRWCSSNSHSTQDEAAAAMANKGIPVFAWKGQTSEEYLWCIEQTLFSNGEWWPNMFLDDGGDLVQLAHQKYSEFLVNVKGVTEETTSGVTLYRKWAKNGNLKIPVINVNDAPTKQKFDNLYGCRESFIDGLKRATDLMIGGKVAVVSGYGYVGKGCAKLLRDYGARVYVTEVDPISALQAAIDGFEVKKLNEVTSIGDIFVTATGNIEVIKLDDMLMMKNGAILCNMGHRNVEVDMDALSDIPKTTIRPLVEAYSLPNGKRVIVLGSGKDVNLACATGHPDFVMSISLTNQTFALIMLNENEFDKPQIYNLPRTYDELNANIHLKSMNIEIDSLSNEQFSYMGIEEGGQLKSDSYLY
ncbi:adenosylhomocysteinase [Priestia megaterium]|uniref:adenosylhomocysteinase n=1 Tax=Priestia megaterium TaxID=1404 RepID=UPI0005C4D8F1|nr:adenosylhomocysteinase [Priestia megaterium]